jgi:putative membrane protein
MIQDHTRLAEDLRQAAIAATLPPPEAAISSDQASLLSSLQSIRGPDFDKTYARQQELAHTQAVAVEESFAEAGTDSNLRKAAQSALPLIREHLKKAQQLSVENGGPEVSRGHSSPATATVGEPGGFPTRCSAHRRRSDGGIIDAAD